MIVLLTSSKTMDFQTPLPFDVTMTSPDFVHDARDLRAHIADLSIEQLQRLQALSVPLAERVRAMNTAVSPVSRPALWAYAGDVYRGFDAASLSLEAAAWANRHIRIPSGLYGLLRPYDAIVPYRLEMKTKVAYSGTNDLYVYWGDRLARTLGEDPIVVLASDEYARAVTRHISDKHRIFNVSFIDHRGDKEVKIPLYNKIMRGVAARWLADIQATHPHDLHDFSARGYRYSRARSTPNHVVFYREDSYPMTKVTTLS